MSHSLYLDTNVLISLLEGEGPSHEALWSLISLGDTVEGLIFCTSALSFTELLAKPYRERNHALAQQYLSLAKAESWLSVSSVSPQVVEITAVIRAKLRMKLPDAIHLATAICSGCSHVLTADAGFSDLHDLEHPISGRLLAIAVQIVRPDPASLSDLSKALQ